MTFIREWRESTLFNIFFWALCTAVLFNLVAQLGHGWEVSLAVSIGADTVTYIFCKVRAWRSRQVTVARSSLTWFAVWLFFFLANIPITWVLINHLGTIPGRFTLGAMGIAMNPVMFFIRDEWVFPEKSGTEVE